VTVANVGDGPSGYSLLGLRLDTEPALCGNTVWLSDLEPESIQWRPFIGSQLPPRVLERVFEPFFTTKGTGLGMGLAICTSIIKSHGGRIWAENNSNGGATFFFELPIDESAQ